MNNKSPSDLEYIDEVSGKTGVSITVLRKLNDSGYIIVPKDLIDLWESEKTKEKNSVLLNSYNSTCKSLVGGECTLYSIDNALNELKLKEPTSDNEFFRLAIIGYELHDMLTELHKSVANIFRAIVYSNRFKGSKKIMFKDGFKDKDTILGEGKLAMADLLTQLYLLCISLKWDFQELRVMGLSHLRERHKDFKRDGWNEVSNEKK